MCALAFLQGSPCLRKAIDAGEHLSFVQGLRSCGSLQRLFLSLQLLISGKDRALLCVEDRVHFQLLLRTEAHRHRKVGAVPPSSGRP